MEFSHSPSPPKVNPARKLTLQEITVLLEVPRPGLYLPQPPSPWSSNQNSPEETLTAASQVLQNQRKRSPTPRSPRREAHPPPLRPQSGRPPSQGRGQLCIPPQGWAPGWSRRGVEGGENWCSVLQQLWALETPNQKELMPPGAREIEGICSPKGKQRCPLHPTSPEPDSWYKSWGRRGERRLTGALRPKAGAREGALPPLPPWMLTHFS